MPRKVKHPRASFDYLNRMSYHKLDNEPAIRLAAQHDLLSTKGGTDNIVTT